MDDRLSTQKGKEIGVLSFILNRVVVHQKLLAEVIAKVEDRTQEEVLARMDELLKQNEAETIYYLKKYWLADAPANGQEDA